MAVVISFLTFALFVVSLIDIIRRDNAEIRYLPKFVWIIIVILLPLLGSIFWWARGREYNQPLNVRLPQRPTRARPQQHRVAPALPVPASDARTTEQQIADLDREIEEWRLRDELARRQQSAPYETDGNTDLTPPEPEGGSATNGPAERE